MEIILLQDVKNLGKKNDVRKVSDGYARNFLLPKKMAKLATKDAVKNIETQKAKEKEKEETDQRKIGMMAENLRDKKIIIKSKAKNDKLFGSISKKDIAKALSGGGLEIDEKKIIIEAAIKKTGTHKIGVELSPGSVISVKLEIIGT